MSEGAGPSGCQRPLLAWPEGLTPCPSHTLDGGSRGGGRIRSSPTRARSCTRRRNRIFGDARPATQILSWVVPPETRTRGICGAECPTVLPAAQLPAPGVWLPTVAPAFPGFEAVVPQNVTACLDGAFTATANQSDKVGFERFLWVDLDHNSHSNPR